MTKRKLDNSLYVHLKSTISQAISLEYAIRSAQQTHNDELQQLTVIDEKIRQFWIDRGSNEAQISRHWLMDIAWDLIQVGTTLTRRHLTPLTPQVLSIVNQASETLPEIFRPEVAPLLIPATRYFRIADLLRGNDILGMLNTVVRVLMSARSYIASDEIELNKFALGIREPIHLHPAMSYGFSNHVIDGHITERFGILFDMEMEISVADIHRLFCEFLYQYAVRRKPYLLGRIDSTRDQLLRDFLKDDMEGNTGIKHIARLDGFASILSGLYCWDQVRLNQLRKIRSPVATAFNQTELIYPKGQGVKPVSPEAIHKNYYTARKAIQDMGTLFTSH